MRNTVGQRAASDYLQDLLLRPGVYRDRWERRATRGRRDAIHQLAVAEVMADYLRAAPRTPADAGITARQVKDTVSRALTGRLMSRATLALFIAAFAISEDESGMLWRLWNGSAPVSVAINTDNATAARAAGTRAHQTLPLHHHVRVGANGRIVDAAAGPRRHRTVSLHDDVWIGADGRIDRAHTRQVIEAIAPGVDRIAFLCDPGVRTVELGQGCRELIRPPGHICAGLFAAEMLLTRTLDAGETLTLEYWLSYRRLGESGGMRGTGPGAAGSLSSLDVRGRLMPHTSAGLHGAPDYRRKLLTLGTCREA